MGMPALKHRGLPRAMPAQGVYLFSEGQKHLYVGRSNRIRQRYGEHHRPSSTHNSAPFAFKLAREMTGQMMASYASDQGSRAALLKEPQFFKAFEQAKSRVRAMDFRFVEETDQTKQTLLELYCAIVLDCPYNDFDTH